MIDLDDIIEEIKNDIRNLTFKKFDKDGHICNEWVNCLSYNDDIAPILNKYKNNEKIRKDNMKAYDEFNKNLFGKYYMQDPLKERSEVE